MSHEVVTERGGESMAAQAGDGRRRARRSGTEGTLALRGAATRLGLKPGELELGVRLGVVRTVAGPEGRRRVPVAEVEHLRSAGGFPDALRERVRCVAATEGAALMGIGPARFTRLARAGCFSPVAFYVNRYRALVWLYPVAELRKFAEREPALLTGSTPRNLRKLLDAGEDWRARNWRSRRVAQLAREAENAWERAAVAAAVLGTDQLAEVVDDPYERAHLRRLRASLLPAKGEPPSSRPLVEPLLTADDPDEILWHRISLALCLDEARAEHPAPRPGEAGPPRPRCSPEPAPGTGREDPGAEPATGTGVRPGRIRSSGSERPTGRTDRPGPAGKPGSRGLRRRLHRSRSG
ncbi:hypothetical protein KBZ10_14455 [Streptomyces sp. F63]|uniref:DUF6397 family protein n=1 Tax=Streptomyces sp. F63 TaxID=2824887 RepID=UPI001B384609|nr:DUF6397 family protein [Streptomyces sp. F63]MBQ0985696.1 hypothetical protein [Streptomyces sp. F63]